jgi:hypothetical protein
MERRRFTRGGARVDFWATGPEIPRDFSVRRYLSASLTDDAGDRA